MEKRRQRLVNCVEGHNIWHGLGKDFVAVMDHWWSFPWLLSPTNTKVADAAWKQVVPSLASLRYVAPRCYPMLNVLPFGKYFPHTRSHMTPPLKQGRLGAVVGTGGAGGTGPGRRKTENMNWYQCKGEGEQKDRLEAAQRKGNPQQKRSVTPLEKLRHPEMLLKG